MDPIQNFSLRMAGVADAPALAELNRPVQASHAAIAPHRFRPDFDAQGLRGFFQAALAKPGHAAMVAEGGGAPVGYVWWEVERRAATPFFFAYEELHIHHLAVAPEWRAQGVGGALMAEAERAGRAAGCQEAALNVWSANAAALRFYEKRGYGARRLLMAKRLG